MKLIQVTTTKLPRIVDNCILECYANETVVIDCREQRTLDLGFNIELVPRVRVRAYRHDHLFVTWTLLPHIGIVNWGERIVIEKHSFLCYLDFTMLFTIRPVTIVNNPF